MLQVKGRVKEDLDTFPELTIGEVARRAGVATSQIRYYERIGLLAPPERISGQRRYEPDVLGRLGFIGVAQSAGFKLREIKELVHGVDHADGLSERLRSLSERKLHEVQELLERTQVVKGWLEVARECGCATPDECTLFASAKADPAAPSEVVREIKVAGGRCRRPA